jgi:hypothetical protein
VTFDRTGIEFVNRAQVMRSLRTVMWHPDADLEEFVRSEMARDGNEAE